MRQISTVGGAVRHVNKASIVMEMPTVFLTIVNCLVVVHSEAVVRVELVSEARRMVALLSEEVVKAGLQEGQPILTCLEIWTYH